MSQPEQQLASAYISVLQQSYKKQLVVLGVYRAKAVWDLRPVFLDPETDGTLQVMRITRPDCIMPESIAAAWGNLPTLLHDTYLAAGTGLVIFQNNPCKLYWSLRRYCSNTLEDQFDTFKAETLKLGSSSGCLNLLGQLAEFEARLAPHGHVTKSNIGIQNHRLCLLDPWFNALAAEQSASVENLTPKAFSSIFLNLFGAGLEAELIVAFQKALTSEPAPSTFSELLKYCSPSKHREISNFESAYSQNTSATQKPTSTQSSSITSASSPTYNLGSAPSGRIIQPRARSIEPEKPIDSPPKEFLEDPLAKATSAKVLAIETPFQQTPQTKTVSNRGLMFFAVALIACMLVMASSKALKFSASDSEISEMQLDWESNDTSRMTSVAEAALAKRNEDAQQIIEIDLLAGNTRPSVNPNFLKTAFNELWADDLSANDRLFAFSLTLAALYRIPSDRLPSIQELHPGILLSLLGDMSLQSSQGKFDTLGIEKLERLPGTYGAVFQELEKLGVKTFADVAARAAARLITGASDIESLEAFIGPNSRPEETEQKLVVLVPFCEKFPELGRIILTSLASKNDFLAKRVKWFVEDNIAQWDQVDQKTLVYIILGLVPEDMQSFERTVDLLQYPLAGVREQARGRILTILGKPFYADFLTFLINKPGLLNRSQTLGLLAATRVPTESLSPFLASWLNSNPDPQVVFQFLLANSQQESYDAVFVQLANYLARSDLEISEHDMSLLLKHPEALARALAFPRLDATNSADRKVLEQWLQFETSPRLKEQIQAKLNAVTAEK